MLAYLVRNRLWLPYRDAQLAGYIPGWRNAVPLDSKWQIFEKLLKRLADGRRVVVVALPPKENVVSGDYEFSTSLAAVSRRLDLGFINLVGVLRPEHFYEVDIHWNVHGHRVVAEHLSQVVYASAEEGGRCAEGPPNLTR